jgi:hypothetical protein
LIGRPKSIIPPAQRSYFSSKKKPGSKRKNRLTGDKLVENPCIIFSQIRPNLSVDNVTRVPTRRGRPKIVNHTSTIPISTYIPSIFIPTTIALPITSTSTTSLTSTATIFTPPISTATQSISTAVISPIPISTTKSLSKQFNELGLQFKRKKKLVSSIEESKFKLLKYHHIKFIFNI